MRNAFVFTVATLLATATLASQQTAGTSEPRRITRNGPQPIISYLRPDELHVILEHRGFPPNATVPQGSRVEHLSKTNDIIAVGRVEAVTPQLVWRGDDDTNRIADDSTANWIRSIIQLQVERVIKDRLNAIPFLLSFARDGGSAVVGTTRVDFVIAGSRPVVEQRRYLVWGNMKDGAFARTAIYEITSAGRLASLTASTAKDELQILSLDEAVAAIDVALGR